MTEGDLTADYAVIGVGSIAEAIVTGLCGAPAPPQHRRGSMRARLLLLAALALAPLDRAAAEPRLEVERPLVRAADAVGAAAAPPRVDLEGEDVEAPLPRRPHERLDPRPIAGGHRERPRSTWALKPAS